MSPLTIWFLMCQSDHFSHHWNTPWWGTAQVLGLLEGEAAVTSDRFLYPPTKALLMHHTFDSLMEKINARITLLSQVKWLVVCISNYTSWRVTQGSQYFLWSFLSLYISDFAIAEPQIKREIECSIKSSPGAVIEFVWGKFTSCSGCSSLNGWSDWLVPVASYGPKYWN